MTKDNSWHPVMRFGKVVSFGLLFTLLFSGQARSVASPQQIRPCSHSETIRAWTAAENHPGTTVTYRIEPSLPVTVVQRIDRIDRQSITVASSRRATGSKQPLDFGVDRYELKYGFLPLESGSTKSDLYWRWSYDNTIDRIWSAPQGKEITGHFNEFSSFFGKARNVAGVYKAKILGCAKITVDSQVDVAKVIRVIMTGRSLNVHVQPPTEDIKTRDSTYFVSLSRGLVLRDESGNMARQAVAVQSR